jgi:hypothetical protein
MTKFGIIPALSAALLIGAPVLAGAAENGPPRIIHLAQAGSPGAAGNSAGAAGTAADPGMSPPNGAKSTGPGGGTNVAPTTGTAGAGNAGQPGMPGNKSGPAPTKSKDKY